MIPATLAFSADKRDGRVVIVRAVLFWIVAAALLTQNALADASQFAPASVVHVLYLQTQGMLASMAVVEPCTSDGMSDAVKRNDAAVENQDVVTLATEQNGFSVGFARCALNATTAENLAAFSSATIQCGVSVIQAHRAEGILEPSDNAKAAQFLTIAKWLLGADAANKVDKNIASSSIKSLRQMHLL